MTGHRADAELLLMALVARKFYLGGLTKSEIASQLYLSRFKVARLLDEAAAQGIVKFTIGLPGDVNVGLSRELQTAFRLRHAVVIDDHEEPDDSLMARLGGATAMLLADIVKPGDVVGVASTRTMMGIGETDVRLAPSRFVQLTGALPRRDAVDVISAIRRLTSLASGEAYVFYAPMVALSREARTSYLAQPEVKAAFTQHSKLSVYITGVGDWSPGLSLIHDALPEELRTQAARHGAVAEVGVPVDERGATVQCDARDHIMAPNVEVLKGTRDRIGVVFDPQKAKAVRIVVETGIVNTLVTHRGMAEALLSQ